MRIHDSVQERGERSKAAPIVGKRASKRASYTQRRATEWRWRNSKSERVRQDSVCAHRNELLATSRGLVPDGETVRRLFPEL